MKKVKFLEKILKKVLFCIFIILNYSYGMKAVIFVDPDTIVHVGQHVFFSGAKSIVNEGEEIDTFAWDFGDGYALKNGYPYSYSGYTGISCTHPFMKPGIFKVELYVVDKKDKNIRDTARINIHVKGVAPIAGFEVWHAPIHARIAQFFYVQIPENVRLDASNKLRIRLIKNKSKDSLLLEKNNLAPEETLLFRNGDLPSGDYSLVFELLKSNNEQISEIVEFFSKDYDGIPAVGINEYNAICVKGKPFFPVTPWILKKSNFQKWYDGKYVNCMYGEGYYDTHNSSTWEDYLKASKERGWYVIGPCRGDWQTPKPYIRNTDIFKLKSYIDVAKDEENLLMWGLWDEPNMGGRYNCIPVEVIHSHHYYVSKNDMQHPTCVNLYGYDYLPYYDDKNNFSFYDFLNNAPYFGGKKTMFMDVIGFDIYPLRASRHVSLKGRHVISEFVAAFKKMIYLNRALVPVMSFIEVQKNQDDTIPQITPQQILMEAWLCVVHGAKGINWFQFFGETPVENLNAMGIFNSQIRRYCDIILSPPPSKKVVTTDANSVGRRVDLMYRKYGKEKDTTHYIFAVRLTEPDSGEFYIQSNEPDTITVTFDVSSFAQQGKIIIDGTTKELEIKDGKFSDKFAKCEVKIYRLGKDLSEVITPPNYHNNKKEKKLRKGEIRIYNLQGKIIHKIKNSHNSFLLAKGVYIEEIKEIKSLRRFVNLR